MKITKQEILRKANEIRQECYALVMKTDGYRIVEGLDERLDMIRFVVSTRMTSSAGSAQVRTGLVKLSLPYFEDTANFAKEFRNVVLHEIAHVLSPPTRSHRSSKRSSHGFAWQAMHRSLGGTGERCHGLDLAVGYERKKTLRISVECHCGCGQTMKLGPTQFKKAQAGCRYYLKGHGQRRNPAWLLP